MTLPPSEKTPDRRVAHCFKGFPVQFQESPKYKKSSRVSKRRQMSSDIVGISTPAIPMTSLKVAATNVNK
jgi:hypothetical protein